MKWLFVVLASMLLLVACENQGTTAPTTQASDTAQENAAENSAVQESGAEREFESFFAKRNLQWKIAYDLKSDADGKQMTTQMTQYIKGENRFRTDMMVENMESRMYMMDQTFTMCAKNDGSWSCFKSTPKEGQTPDSKDWESEYEANEAKYSIVSDGTKVVAGVTAKCFKVVDPANTGAVVRYCFSSDGAPLYMYFKEGTSTTEMIATSYSKSVSESDFTPPAEAKDLGAMYGGTSPAGGDTSGMCGYCNYMSGTEKDECLANC